MISIMTDPSRMFLSAISRYPCNLSSLNKDTAFINLIVYINIWRTYVGLQHSYKSQKILHQNDRKTCELSREISKILKLIFFAKSVQQPLVAQLAARRTVVSMETSLQLSLGSWFESGQADCLFDGHNFLCVAAPASSVFFLEKTVIIKNQVLGLNCD